MKGLTKMLAGLLMGLASLVALHVFTGRTSIAAPLPFHHHSTSIQNDLVPSLRSRRLLLQSSTSNKNPIVHTFYHEYNAAAGGTGMTTAADQALLKVWVDEWTAAGWNPVILNMEDTRQHPQFDTMNKMLDGLPFKYYDVSCKLSMNGLGLLEINSSDIFLLFLVKRLCFLRWLAIAQAGGGWMV
jgi:hypothetical protein